MASLNAGVTQLARVTAFQAVGRGFESRLPLMIFLKIILLCLLCHLGLFSCGGDSSMSTSAWLRGDTPRDIERSLFEVNRQGLGAIPSLIESIDDTTASSLWMVNPTWSTLNHRDVEGVRFRGILAAYAIELILSGEERDTTAWSPNSTPQTCDLCRCIYWRNYISKVDHSDQSLEVADLLEIKRAYGDWWNANRHRSLSELRADWAEFKRPLTGSGYYWQ